MNKFSSAKKSAFSLIELSIVLIIIGLLIAGITGGASLIKSSELRSVVTEARSWAIAVNGFYNQFDALPGDYATALGVAASDGDGDGTIEYVNGAGTNPYEGRGAWVHLKAAGILDATVLSSAVAVVPTTGSVSTFGVNLPKSKIKSSGWDFDYNSTSTQNVVVLTGAITASAGAVNSLVNGTPYATGAITPTDALSIDSKFDDGDPEAGKVRGVLSTCVGAGVYTTATTTKACALSYQIDVNS